MVAEHGTHEWKLEMWNAYIRGASVALIGGDDKIDWPFIDDNYPIVARVNGHWQRQRGRCSVLYYSCADDLDLKMFDDKALYLSLKFAWVNASHTLFNSAHQITRFALVCQLLSDAGIITLMYVHAPAQAFETFDQLKDLGERYQWARDCAELGNFHPLTGMLALYHLTRSQASAIYVDGMNMYRGADGKLPNAAGVHDIGSQVRFLKDLWMNDTRIDLSSNLLEAVAPN